MGGGWRVGVRGVTSGVCAKVMGRGKDRREREGTQRKQRDVTEREGGRSRELGGPGAL